MKRWQVYAKKSIISVWTEYLRATAAMDGLPAESSYRMQKGGGEVLGMLN